MTIWLLFTDTPPPEGKQEALLKLPFYTDQDFTSATNPGQVRQKLKAANPDKAPEALDRESERIWKYIHRLQPEDILVIPSKERQEAAFAEVRGFAVYAPDAERDSSYRIPAAWFDRRVPFQRFGRRRKDLEDDTVKLREIGDARLRSTIRGWLRLKASWAMRWAWILAVFFLLRLFHLVLRFDPRVPGM
jgi:hypothetical protein